MPEQTGPRLLLARSSYYSAPLGRAGSESPVLVERGRVGQYARLMLGRTPQRQGRHAETGPPPADRLDADG